MEKVKRRKIEEEDKEDKNMETIVKNQEELLKYIFEIGRLSEMTFTTIHTLQSKVASMEERFQQFENEIKRINHTFVQELKSKDVEITALKELNQNIINDYEEKMKICQKENNSVNNYSYYS